MDPVDENNVWMFTEYAEVNNKWGTWVGKIRMVPFPGAYVFTRDDSLDFGELDFDVTQNSDTLSATISNYGSDVLTISNIPSTLGSFKLTSNISFPIQLSSYETLSIKFIFSPTAIGQYSSLYPVNNNDPNFSGIPLKG